MENIVRTDFDLQQGARYRQLPKGDSSPTDPKWTEYARQLSASKRQQKSQAVEASTDADAMTQPAIVEQPPTPVATPATVQPAGLTPQQEIQKRAIDQLYSAGIAQGDRHKTFMGETAAWLLFMNDNSQAEALKVAGELDYIKKWKADPQSPMEPYELENVLRTVSQQPLLRRLPKRLTDLLPQVSAEVTVQIAASSANDPLAALPFDRWCDQIESFFDVYPCLREVCEPHPRRLWPFLLFAAAAMLGTCMDLCYYYFYANEGERQRLNYIIWGVGDPASGKHCLQRICDLLLAPIIAEGALADESTNSWKTETDAKGQNKDREIRPAIFNRMFGYRSSNAEFIRSMINCKEEVDGEMMGRHMVTCSSEKDVEIGKAGSWISRSSATLLSFHGEWDSQHYSNKQSVSGRYRVFWNQIETFCPITLPKLVNERNVNSGLDTRTCTIPMGRDDFKIMPLRRKEDSRIDAYNETLMQWAYRQDQRRGELPLWPLVEHVHGWLDQRRAIAEFNDEDRAEWLLLKRIPYHMINVSAPWIDMRHAPEREQTGTYTLDATDFALADLVGDIQYRTQMFWYYDLHRLYYDNQLREAAQQKRRTNKFVECFRQLPEEFNNDQFAKVFGYANTHSAQKTLERLIDEKAIERTMRGNYHKLVSEL